MKLYTIEQDCIRKLAVSFAGEEQLYLLKENGFPYETMQQLIEGWNDELQEALYQLKEKGEPMAGTYRLCAPIPVPRQDVICLGINYYAHAKGDRALRHRHDIEKFPNPARL